jgi:hypothetical protein
MVLMIQGGGLEASERCASFFDMHRGWMPPTTTKEEPPSIRSQKVI